MQNDGNARARFASSARAMLVSLQLLALSLACAQTLKAQEHLSLTASDGVKVYGDFYPPHANRMPTFCFFTRPGRTAGYTPRLPPPVG